MATYESILLGKCASEYGINVVPGMEIRDIEIQAQQKGFILPEKGEKKDKAPTFFELKAMYKEKFGEVADKSMKVDDLIKALK